MLRLGKYVFAVFVLAAIGLAFYAFAASVAVPQTNAGDGSNVVQGYTVTGVTYTIDSAVSPTAVTRVTFNVGASAKKVKAQLITGGTWFTCVSAGGTSWYCNLSGVSASAITGLEVVASNN